MSRTRKWSMLLLAPALALSLQALATTWSANKIKCPLCGATVEVEQIMSYGSYIYGWPSKLRLLFWPRTESRVLYFCKKCHLSLLMGDFKQLPAEKVEAVRKAVAAGKKEQPDKPYYQIPMAYRLKQAEAAYQALGRDDAFWAAFYRMAAYHLEVDKDAAAELKAARERALAATERLLAQKTKEPPVKESLIVRAGLLYQLGRKDEALAALEKARQILFDPAGDMPEENKKNGENYLNQVAGDLQKVIDAGKPLPR